MCERKGVAAKAMTPHKRYTVRYRDADSTPLERCYYALSLIHI